MNSMCDYHISPSHVFLSSIEPISNYLQQTTYLFNVMKVNGEHCRWWTLSCMKQDFQGKTFKEWQPKFQSVTHKKLSWLHNN